MTMNRRILLDPRVRRLLDVAMRMPGGANDRDAAVRGVITLVEDLVRRAADAGMDVGGYDHETMEIVGNALAKVMERRSRDMPLGDEGYERMLAGAIVGVAVGSGGVGAYAHFVKRFGAIPKFVGMGMSNMAMSLRAQRSALDATLAANEPVTLTRAIDHTPGAASKRAKTPAAEADVVTITTIRDMPVDDGRVRRVVRGSEILMHGLDLFEALGYAAPDVSLSQFTARHENEGVSVIVRFASRRNGGEQPTTFLTNKGLFLAVFDMSPRMPRRPTAQRLVAAVVDQLVPASAMVRETTAEIAARQAIEALEAERRRGGGATSRLRDQIARHAETARAALLETARLQTIVDQAHADTALEAALTEARQAEERAIGEVKKLRLEKSSLASHAQELSVLVDRLEKDLETAKRAKDMVDRDLQATTAAAETWRAQVEEMVLGGKNPKRITKKTPNGDPMH